MSIICIDWFEKKGKNIAKQHISRDHTQWNHWKHCNHCKKNDHNTVIAKTALQRLSAMWPMQWN